MESNSSQLKIVPISDADESLEEFPTETGGASGAWNLKAWLKPASIAFAVGAIGCVIALVEGSGIWLNARATAAVPATGTLTIESEPASADVFIDGTARGQTPTTLALIEGK